jgi:hypothetical protein
MTQIILPDSPSAVLQLLNADKQALENFSNAIIRDVKEGRSNPLEIQVLIKKYEFVLNEIKENIKGNVNTETLKHGEKPFTYGGAECHYVPVKTEYDFSSCGDTEWETLDAEISALQSRKKFREAFLKSLTNPITVVSELTGEVDTISPPQNKQTMGLRVTIK